MTITNISRLSVRSLLSQATYAEVNSNGNDLNATTLGVRVKLFSADSHLI
jgi:hypothetical protein